MCGILTYLDDWVILRVNVGTVKILYMEYNGTSVQSYIYICIYTPHLYYIYIIHAPIIVVSSNFRNFANIDVRSVDQQPVKNHVIFYVVPLFYNSMKNHPWIT